MNDMTPFKLTLHSPLHHQRQRCFKNKQQLTEFLMDTLLQLPEEADFQMQISREGEGLHQKQVQIQSLPNAYEVDVLLQQLLLFDREEEMVNYVQTEKLVAGDALSQLTQLSVALLKLGKQLLEDRKPLLPLKVKQQQYSMEQLDRIEAECLNTLLRVRDERKRAENCCICLSTRSDHILLPCMHMVLCRECGRQQLQKCPICSQPIRDIREVYR